MAFAVGGERDSNHKMRQSVGLPHLTVRVSSLNIKDTSLDCLVSFAELVT